MNEVHMSLIRVDEQLLEYYKRSLAACLPEIQSSHRMEAMAAGIGFLTYASLTSARNDAGGVAYANAFSEEAFAARLTKLGYSQIAASSGTLQDMFDYRAFVARQNGYAYETVLALARTAGYADNVSTIFAEVLCSQPLSDRESSVLDAPTVHSILGSVPRFDAPPDRLTVARQRMLEEDPYCHNPGAAFAMITIPEWSIKVGSVHSEQWMMAGVVAEIGARHDGDEVQVHVRLLGQGLRLLRMAQEGLSSEKSVAVDLGTVAPHRAARPR
jgi:hypothetical protein